ncbi:unnamed protein product [Chrysoparadoxa australica]
MEGERLCVVCQCQGALQWQCSENPNHGLHFECLPAFLEESGRHCSPSLKCPSCPARGDLVSVVQLRAMAREWVRESYSIRRFDGPYKAVVENLLMQEPQTVSTGQGLVTLNSIMNAASFRCPGCSMPYNMAIDGGEQMFPVTITCGICNETTCRLCFATDCACVQGQAVIPRNDMLDIHSALRRGAIMNALFSLQDDGAFIVEAAEAREALDMFRDMLVKDTFLANGLGGTDLFREVDIRTLISTADSAQVV